jgi:hypothetical protein
MREQPAAIRDRMKIVEAAMGGIDDFLERRKYLFLILFSIVYFLATGYRASRKLFWFDELFTIYLSRLPDMSSVWSALTHHIDLNPPLFYFLTRSAEGLFGEGQVATRLPEILSFWIFCLCLFRFVSRKSSALCGFIAMLFPLVTTAYYYAYEARPHGIVLGCCGAALICWQAAADREGKRLRWLLGLGAALACGLLNHYYAVMLFVPLALGQLVRDLTFRRVDWPIWLTLAASSTALLVSLPLLHIANTGLNKFFPAGPGMLVKSYQSTLAPAAIVLAGALVLLCIGQIIFAGRPPERNPIRLEIHETAALLTLVAIPSFVFLLAKFTGAPMFARYGISSVAGFGCLLGVLAAGRPVISLGILLLLMGQIQFDFLKFRADGVLEEPSTSTLIDTRMSEFQERYQWMEAIPNKNLPIALVDDLDFMPTAYYAPADLASRLSYVYRPGDPNGEGYAGLRTLNLGPGGASHVADFLAAHDAFLVFGRQRLPWLVDDFIRAGAEVRLEDLSPTHFLLSVTSKNAR